MPERIIKFDKYNVRDFIIPIDYQIADYADPTVRKGSKTKTVKIPGSKINNTLLGHLNEINTNGNFNPNDITEAVIDSGAGRLLQGSLVVRDIVRKDYYDEYELYILAENSEWASRIGDLKLSDLTLPKPVFSDDDIRTSWNRNGDTSGYVWTLIDYGSFGATTTDLALDRTVFQEEMRPSLFVKPLLFQIFENIGYTLEADIFNSFPHRDFILPYVGGAPLKSDPEANKAELSSSGQAANLVLGYVNLDGTVFDNGSNVGSNANTKFYTAPSSGVYDIKVEMPIEFRNRNFLNGGEFGLFLYVNNVEVNASQTIPLPPSTNSFTPADITYNSTVTMNAGDKIELLYSKLGPNNALVQIQGASFEVIPTTIAPIEGQEIILDNATTDMRQIDFIKALLQINNLYAITNNQQKKVQFITRDKFFLDLNESESWEDKIDTANERKFKFISNDYNKVLDFKWKEDRNDLGASEYLDSFSLVFGNGESDLLNQNLEGNKDAVSLPFAGTRSSTRPLRGFLMPQIIVGNKTNNNTITLQTKVTELENQYANGDIDFITFRSNYKQARIEAQNFNVVPRFLIYGGRRRSANPFALNSRTSKNYPYAYFADDSSDIFKLNLHFRNLNDVPGLVLNGEYQGLIERYYSEQIDQINRGRVLTCSLYLTETDIVNLDFRKPKLLYGKYWYLNKVKNYLYGADSVTEVELIEKT